MSPVDQALAAAVIPSWLEPVRQLAGATTALDFSPNIGAPPPEGGKASAVLVLFGPAAELDSNAGASEPTGSVLLIRRADTMRSHAGQPAFPGGRLDPEDGHGARGSVAAALREAAEETGLNPGGVTPFALLPTLWLPPSSSTVTPVIGWWHEPSPVGVVDAAEVAAVHEIALATLLDPAHRFMVAHPSGFVGPAFDVAGMLVWGFTAGLLARLMRFAGWERPWDTCDIRPLDARGGVLSLGGAAASANVDSGNSR